MTDTTTPTASLPAEPSAAGDATASGEAATASDAALPRPRIRTGAVLWGLVLTALGAWALWVATAAERREALLDTVLTMTPLGWTVLVVVAAGATITLLALAAVIRRIQRRLAARTR